MQKPSRSAYMTTCTQNVYDLHVQASCARRSRSTHLAIVQCVLRTTRTPPLGGEVADFTDFRMGYRRAFACSLRVYRRALGGPVQYEAQYARSATHDARTVSGRAHNMRRAGVQQEARLTSLPTALRAPAAIIRLQRADCPTAPRVQLVMFPLHGMRLDALPDQLPVPCGGRKRVCRVQRQGLPGWGGADITTQRPQ